MAVRFRLPYNVAAAVTPTVRGSWGHVPASVPVWRLITASEGDSSALTTVAYTPDASDHIVNTSALHAIFVSDVLTTGLNMPQIDSFKFALQALEAHAGNNLYIGFYIYIRGSDDSVRAVYVNQSTAQTTVELTTSLRNNYRLRSPSWGAGYTTQAGDRFVIEVGLMNTAVGGAPTAGGGTQGHNGSIRWGSNGAGGDLPENDTETGTTLNPWFEIGFNLTFVPPSTTLVVADLAHGHSLDAPALTQQNTLTVAELAHAHSLDGVTISPDGPTSLTVSELAHGHTLDSPTLTQQNILAIAELLHAHSLDGVGLTQAHLLTMQEMLHGHLLDEPLLSTSGTLAPADLLHTHSLDSFGIVQANLLVVGDLRHAHTLDASNLLQQNTLGVADLIHAHTLDPATLTFVPLLVVSDLAHAHRLDNVTVLLQGMLDVQSLRHLHTLDTIGITQQNVLVVQDMVHQHRLDAANIAVLYALNVSDMLHAHRLDGVSIDVAYQLIVQDLLHGHQLGTPMLTSLTILNVADLLHAHMLDGTDVDIIGAPLEVVTLQLGFVELLTRNVGIVTQLTSTFRF